MRASLAKRCEASQAPLLPVGIDNRVGNNDRGPSAEHALQSRRYESYHYPHYNLGRIYMAKQMYVKAREHFEQALKLCPDYAVAREALEKVRRRVQ